MYNVIISLTTIPNRLISPHQNGGVRPVIDLLVNQDYPYYEIHFNIPYVNKKTNEEYKLPNWLLDYGDNKLKIFRTDDYGSMTKLLPTIERVNDPETIIITVDDDLNYENGFIEYHLMKREVYPNSALGFAGIGSINGSCHFCTTLKEDTRVKIIEGYKTVSYKRKFFGDDFKEFVLGNWNDDMIISAYLGKNNIHKIVMNYNRDTDFRPRVESFPVIGHLPNESGGCNIFRTEQVPDNHQHYYKLGYLEK